MVESCIAIVCLALTPRPYFDIDCGNVTWHLSYNIRLGTTSLRSVNV